MADAGLTARLAGDRTPTLVVLGDSSWWRNIGRMGLLD
jgi:hypothetical protein